MSCNGYNHASNCDCGWGGVYYPMQPAGQFSNDFVGISSYVNPNAVYPVCGVSVFYYQDKNGSRVFFNDLGWPWPKHSCTDKVKNNQLIKRNLFKKSNNTDIFDAKILKWEEYQNRLQIYIEILTKEFIGRKRIIVDIHNASAISWSRFVGLRYMTISSGELLIIDPYSKLPKSIPFNER